jgi:hypothetical protein
VPASDAPPPSEGAPVYPAPTPWQTAPRTP